MSKFTRRIVFTITACVLCFGIAIGTLIAVLAQNSLLFNTDVSVNYVSEINANVTARYWLKEDEKITVISDQRIEEGTKTNPDKIDVKLSESQDYVVFEYIFTNNMTNLDAYAHLSYEDTGKTDENIQVYVTTHSSELSVTDEIDKGYQVAYVKNMPYSNVEFKAGETVYVYVKVKIQKLSVDAEFTGKFTWTFSLAAVEYTPDNLPEGVAALTAGTTTLAANTNYMMFEDLEVSAPIDASAFNGTIEGNGHTITVVDAAAAVSYAETTDKKSAFGGCGGNIQNLNVVGGSMILKIPEGAIVNITNCTVAGELVETNYDAAIEDEAEANVEVYAIGGFVRFNQGALTISASTNNANINGKKCVGGFVGAAFGQYATVEIVDSINNGNIMGTLSFAGGFVGKLSDALAVTEYRLGKLTNNGEIKCNSSGGGIIGGNTSGILTINNCTNTKLITSDFTETEGTSGMNVGGIIGLGRGTRVVITNVSNSGKIVAKQGAAAGIIGSSRSSVAEISNATNTGDVDGLLQVAGIVGMINIVDTNTYISDSINKGTITATSSSSAGIVGLTSGHVSISSSYNEGEVVGRNRSAGFVGSVGSSASAHIENSENRAAVGGAHYVAGFVGYMDSSVTNGNALSLLNVTNTAAITGTHDDLGGIVGYAKAPNISINTANNSGAVTGAEARKYVAGIIARAIGDTISITNSDNSGTLSKSWYHVAGIISVCDSVLTMDDCHNTGEIAAARYVGGIAAELKKAATLNNVSNDKTYLGGNSVYTYRGGIVASCADITITGATNTGSIRGYQYIGGIIGASTGAVNISNARNEAIIQSDMGFVGGIVGYMNCDGVSASMQLDYDVVNAGNIKLNGNTAASETVYGVGGVVGVIENLKTELRICASNTYSISGISYDVGGLVGRASGGEGADLYIQGGNEAAVSGYSNIGGFVGYVDFHSIGDCFLNATSNTGKITATATYAGGLIGYSEAYVDLGSGAGVENTGAVTAANYAGGLIGYVATGVVTGSGLNTGTITASQNYAGGCYGYVDFAANGQLNSQDTNGGKVLAKNYAGGIIGYANSSTVTMRGTNSGNVTANTDYAGGLIGYATSVLDIDNSKNSGVVTGFNYIGGLVGYAGATGVITKSHNTGRLSHAMSTPTGYNTIVQGAGGIVGYIAESCGDFDIDKCYNTGAIQSKHYGLGGIVGITYARYLDIIYSVNFGDITGAAEMGGIVGQNCKGRIILSGGMSAATITQSGGDAKAIGGIIGNRASGCSIYGDDQRITYSLNAYNITVSANTYACTYSGWGMNYTNSRVNGYSYVFSVNEGATVNSQVITGNTEFADTAAITTHFATPPTWLVHSSGGIFASRAKFIEVLQSSNSPLKAYVTA